MLKHADIWFAIDALARNHGLTPSALARRAGLDPTTFNKSKRITREGKPRWPSTESVSKVLEATSSTMGEFVGYIDGATRRPVATLPLMTWGVPPVNGRTFSPNGHPSGLGWDGIPFPALNDPNAWALEMAGDSLQPWLRDGDVAIISPAANIRRGDRVVIRTTQGEMVIGALLRQTARRLELAAIDPAAPARQLDTEEIEWMARIVWISQ